jgi:GDP-4-dehydro-6-deoxy-D-mannose reductase
MKIVITGASGFLGSNLVNKLEKANHNVLSILRSTPNPLQTIFDYKPDVVVHCAWKGGNNYEDINDISQQFTNVSDGIELLKTLSSLPNKPKFIGFGSFAEYGNLNNLALEENWEKPTNMYGISKLTLKNYSENFCKTNNIPWSWVRPCYIYGPGDVSTRLIPSTIAKLLHKQTVTLDQCDKIIDYMYIDDFVNFMYNIVTQPTQGVFNICSGQQYKLKDVILMIANMLNANEYLVFEDSERRVLTSNYICGSNLKAKQLNQFNNLISLEEGLIKTISHYKKQI